MQKWLFKILVCSVNVFILAYILPGIYIVDFSLPSTVAIVLSLLDAFVKPLLVLFTLPAGLSPSGFFSLLSMPGSYCSTPILCMVPVTVSGTFTVWRLLSFFTSVVHRRAFPMTIRPAKPDPVNLFSFETLCLFTDPPSRSPFPGWPPFLLAFLNPLGRYIGIPCSGLLISFWILPRSSLFVLPALSVLPLLLF